MSPRLLPLLPSLLPTQQHGDRRGPDALGGEPPCTILGGYGAGGH